jgi:hypothetical protein
MAGFLALILNLILDVDAEHDNAILAGEVTQEAEDQQQWEKMRTQEPVLTRPTDVEASLDKSGEDANNSQST